MVPEPGEVVEGVPNEAGPKLFDGTVVDPDDVPAVGDPESVAFEVSLGSGVHEPLILERSVKTGLQPGNAERSPWVGSEKSRVVFIQDCESWGQIPCRYWGTHLYTLTC